MTTPAIQPRPARRSPGTNSITVPGASSASTHVISAGRSVAFKKSTTGKGLGGFRGLCVRSWGPWSGCRGSQRLQVDVQPEQVDLVLAAQVLERLQPLDRHDRRVQHDAIDIAALDHAGERRMVADDRVAADAHPALQRVVVYEADDLERDVRPKRLADGR